MATGVLCIGDAAHAMSPVGGVGINLAIADAVAAAGYLAEPLRTRPAHRPSISPRYADAEYCRPSRPRRCSASCTAMCSAPVLQGRQATPPRRGAEAARTVPQLTAIPAYLVGVGLLPQHAPDFARR